MKLREYCCCAIPTVNVGMYVALAEQLTLGVIVGVVSIATPDIVGNTAPSFADIILGAIGFAAAALQVLGIIGVARQSTSIVKRFVSLHLVLLIAGFAVAAAWTIMSATGHKTAKSNCETDFFDMNDNTQASLANTLCEIFPWVDVGIMGGLWVLLAIVQLYLYVVMQSYSSYLQDNRGGSYGSLETIPMKAHADVWDSRVSPDDNNAYYPGYPAPSTYPPPQQHARGNSTTSMSDIMSEPARQPRDGYNDYETTGYPHAQDAVPASTVYQGTHDYGRPAHARY